MKWIEIPVPPVPQFEHAGRFAPGLPEFETFFNPQTYTMMFIVKGGMQVRNDNVWFELTEGNAIILEPRRKTDVRPLNGAVEYYYIQFTSKPGGEPGAAENIVAASSLPDTMIQLPTMFRVDLQSIIPVLDHLILALEYRSLENVLLLQTQFLQLLMRLYQSSDVGNGDRSAEICRLVIHYLQCNSADDFNRKKMENELHYHFNYLSRCLKKHTGMTPLQFLQHIRMEKAKELLKMTNYSVQNVAEHVGIGNYNYFIRLFKKSEHITPMSYRQKYNRAL